MTLIGSQELVLSSRRELLQRVMQLWRRVRGGSYHPRRGPILWQSWDFGSRPRGVAVMVPETMPFAPDSGTDRMELELEIGASWAPGSLEEFDDDLLDEMFDDFDWVVRSLEQEKNSAGDSLAMHVRKKEAVVQEWSDMNFGVQGLIVSIPVQY